MVNPESVLDKIKAIDRTTSGEEAAVEQLKALTAGLETELNMSEKDAKYAIMGLAAAEGEKKGATPEQLFSSYPKAVQDYFEYTPADLRRNQTITVAGEGLSLAGFLGATFFALRAGAAWVAVFAATKNPWLATAAAAKPAIFSALLSRLGWLFTTAVNNLNDVFHWGPVLGQNAISDVSKTASTYGSNWVTTFGKLTEEQVTSLYQGLKIAGADGIDNPVGKWWGFITLENVKKAVNDLIVAANGQGRTPTPAQVVAELQTWITYKGQKAQNPAIGGMEVTGYEKAIYQFTPLARVVPEKKEKLFLGTIFSGRIGSATNFKRTLDDRITDEADLLNDAKVNLAKWLVYFPSLLTFEIQLKYNPFDWANVKRPGLWATMALYVNNRYGKRMFIDEVLLGPIDPNVYFPDAQRMLEVAQDLPEFAGFTQPETITEETTPVAGALPTPPPTPTPAPAPVSPPPPTTVQPPPPEPVVAPPTTTKKTYQDMASNYALASEAIKILYGSVDSYAGQTGANAQRAWWENYRNDQNTMQGLATAYNAKQQEAAPATTETEFAGGFKGIKVNEIYAHVNISVLLVRSGPGTQYPLAGVERLYSGNDFKVVGWVKGQSVDGEDRWWVSQFGNYVWVGGTTEKP